MQNINLKFSINNIFSWVTCFLMLLLFTTSCRKEGVATMGTFSYSTATSTFVSGGTAASSVIPTFTGGTAGAYSTTSTLPAGLTLNASTGVISWTGNIAVGVYAINVKNVNAAESVIYSLTITAASVFSYSTATSTFVSGGTAASSVIPTFTGGTAGAYSTTSTLPAELTLNASTGVISWTGNIAVGVYAINVKNVNAAESVIYSLTITAASVFSYSTATSTFVSGGTAASSVIPTFTGGTAGAYSTTSTLPAELTLNASTGVISWTGTIAAGSYPVIVKNANATATVTYTLTVTAAVPVSIALPLTFELTPSSSYTFTNFDGGAMTIVANPSQTNNTSANVAKMVKSAGQPWGGSFLTLTNPIDFSTNKTFTMKVYSPRVGAKVLLKVEHATDGNINFEREMLTTKANEWEVIAFNYTAISTTNAYSKVVLIFDNGTQGDGSVNYTFYVDDITLSTVAVDPNAKTQIELPVTFESSTIDYKVTDFGNNSTIDTTDPSGGANKVKKTTKNTGAETWAGTTMGTNNLGFKTPIATNAATAPKMTVRIYSPSAGIPIRLKIEDHANNTHSCETQVNTTVANGWETITFDFASPASGTAAFSNTFTYDKASIFFDFNTTGSGKIFYWDDVIKL